ncbi:hypothetical protein PLANTIT3_60060 [Plantibacter sp. T3]|nr:hypothetical protein PLANTIT3_60060 [Plantibacter sp. T3]
MDARRVRGELRPRRAVALRRHAVDAGGPDLLVDERPRRRGLPARRRRDPQGRRHRGGDHHPPPGVSVSRFLSLSKGLGPCPSTSSGTACRRALRSPPTTSGP